MLALKKTSRRATNNLVHNEINYLILFGFGRSAANRLVELAMYYSNKIEIKGL